MARATDIPAPEYSDDEVIAYDEEAEYDEEEEDTENTITLRCKWIMDDAKTLDEGIEKVEKFIDYLKSLRDEGWEFEQPMNDDWGFLRRRT